MSTTNQKLSEQALRDLGTGNDYALRGQDASALPFYRRAYENFEIAHDRGGRGLAALALAVSSQGQDLHEKAEELYQEARSCFFEIGMRSRERQVLYGWGNLCRERSQLERARMLYLEGIQLAHDEIDEQGEAQGYRNLGDTWAAEGHFSEAISYCQKGLQLAQHAQDRNEQRQSLHSLGSLYSSVGDRKEAIECYTQALQLADESTNPAELVGCLIALSMESSAIGLQQQALKFWEEAAELAKQLGPAFEQAVQQARPR
jgi:tetratricopeptide (TPR) repeat protein